MAIQAIPFPTGTGSGLGDNPARLPTGAFLTVPTDPQSASASVWQPTSFAVSDCSEMWPVTGVAPIESIRGSRPKRQLTCRPEGRFTGPAQRPTVSVQPNRRCDGKFLPTVAESTYVRGTSYL